MAHLENVIADTSKKTDRATLQGKFTLLSEANVILRSALLTDLLVPAKTLSLISQRVSTDVITIVNTVQNTREKYVKWYEHFSENPEKVFELPTLKSAIERVDEENNFQGVKLKHFS